MGTVWPPPHPRRYILPDRSHPLGDRLPRLLTRCALVPFAVASLLALASCDSTPSEPDLCGEETCTPVAQPYISHFTELDCTGQEAYFTGYMNYDGIKRSWDGLGLAGTTLRTLTHKSFKDALGVCDNAWPTGNTLPDFVRIYR